MTTMPKAWVQAKTPLIAKEEPTGSLPGWWTALSDEQKEEYVQEHPNSKYADVHRQQKTKTTPQAPTKPAPVKHAVPKPEGEHKVPHRSHENESQHEAHKPSPPHPHEAPGSPERKKVALALKSKAGSILSHVKGEAKEWHSAGKALKGLATGKGIDAHGKKAIASVAADVAIIAASVASGGGLAHGAVAFLHHFGAHFLQDIMIKSAVKGAIHKHEGHEGHAAGTPQHASVLVIGGEDITETMTKTALEELIKFIENGNLEEYMKENAHLLTPEARKELGLIEKAQPTKAAVTARIDMSAEVAGSGLCPECKKPMITAMFGKTKMWSCPEHRISFPIPDEPHGDQV